MERDKLDHPETETEIIEPMNDVYSPQFTSKLDRYFRSSWEAGE
jgi:hypothetical protein